jgi:hypothetical protein
MTVKGIKKQQQRRVTKRCSTAIPSTYRNNVFIEPHTHDILCGRGGGAVLEHQGNYKLIDMVLLEMEKYHSSTGKKSNKSNIIQKILEDISNLKPAGRFLNKKNNNWFEQDNVFARKTIAKTFRDQAKKMAKSKKGTSLVADLTSSLVTSSLVMVVSMDDITEPVKSYNDTDDNYNYNYNYNYNDDVDNDDEDEDEDDDDDIEEEYDMDLFSNLQEQDHLIDGIMDGDDLNINWGDDIAEEYDMDLFSNLQEQDHLIDGILDGDDLNINWGDDFEWKWDATFEWNWDGEYDLNYEKINVLLNL